MKIGYACTPITTNARTNRRILLKDFSKDKFLSITKQNLDDLQKILEWNDINNQKRLDCIKNKEKMKIGI